MAVYVSKHPTKDGRKYYFRIRYKDIYGNSIDYSSGKFKHKKEAEYAESIKRIEVASNNVRVADVTFKQVFNEYIVKKSKQIKLQSVEKTKVLFEKLKSIQDTKPDEFNLTKYKKLQAELEKKKFSVDYMNKIFNLLINLIKYSKKYYGTSDTILDFIEKYVDPNKIKQEMLFFTYEEYLQFDSVITDFEYHTFFEILFFMGLRCGECQALTWNDIDFTNHALRINKTLTTKIKGMPYLVTSPKTKNSCRTLPLTDKIINDLKVLKDKQKGFKDFTNNWFIFGCVKPFAESSITNKKNKYCELAKVQKIRIHDFRHSCASLLINKGASITLVSKWLGHSSIDITLRIYAHLYKNELVEMLEILNKL